MLEETLLDGRSFVVGFVIGAVVVSVLARMFTSAFNSWGNSKKSGKDVSVSVQGKESAQQIVRKSIAAGTCFVFWLIGIGLALAAVIITLYRIWYI